MKNFTAILLLVCTLNFISRNSQATHIIGAEISYEAVSPGVFLAVYKSYALANSVIPPASNVTFNLRSPGCNVGFPLTGNLQTNTSLFINGGTSNNCGANPPQLAMVATYTATFALSLPQFQCAEWFLSVRECSKSVVANIEPSQNACLYVEATLTAFTGSLQANSPAFVPPASLIFNLNAPATYNNQAILSNSQPDSIVYSLKPAKNDQNVFLNYTANTSFSQPLPTSSGVTLHPNTGIMTFTPNVYHSNATIPNAYTVVVEAAAYRKINGISRKVSASQRNLPIFIVNNPANLNPELLNVSANGQPVQPNELVSIRSGNVLNFQFSTADANAGDVVTLVLPDPQFPGFPANTNTAIVTGNRPTGTLTFNTAPIATDQIFYFPVMVMDNACPARGVTTRVYGVKLLASPLGLQNDARFDAGFQAYPNPFTEAVSFTCNLTAQAERIMICNLLGQQIDEILIPKVLSGEQNIHWQNAGKYAAGTYVAKLISADKTIRTLKFTKL
ncbi:T9SS type A sorting domain-containing protein [Adhaeribacter sp. BT258]|uniref:T9SS type A sorting domain-containing protein n=1 Tax=Adhaeribacter terrigena TaxID=2793070 RepID=A0ABS1C3U4_9BACT|nr:T9SS type A sorting domain-containing protein [Adhaeribacter terrigena]MBK0403988.1 T9SS type A sorting domain-containing protein [Adhaeribacter terrigena]